MGQDLARTEQLDAVEQAELNRLESVIERGLRTFIDVGNALKEIRDGRLYRREYWAFDEYCEKRWGFSNSRAYQYIDAATTVAVLSTIVEESSIPQAESQVRPLTSLPPEQQAAAWQQAVATAPNGKITAAHVQDVVDAMRARSSGEPVDFDTYVASRPDAQAEPVKQTWYQSSESDDWWTPQWLFDMLNTEFCFTTDVCASDANHKCAKYFTRADDGLAQEWTGACWMNPPYGRSAIGSDIGQWVRKAFESAQHGALLVCLVPARVDTQWWWNFCRYGEVRFMPGRLRFSDAGAATFPSAVVIFHPFMPAESTQVIWWEVRQEATDE